MVLPLVSTSRANPSASQKPDRARTFILQLHDQGGNQSTRTYDKGKPFCIAETGPGPYLQPQADRPAASSFRVGKLYLPAGYFALNILPTEPVNILRTGDDFTGRFVPHSTLNEYSRHRKTLYGPETNISDVLFHARSNRVQSSP